MYYLSRVELDTKKYNGMALSAASRKIHGAIESSFSGERRRRLWRLDQLGRKLYLLLLSEEVPQLGHFVEQFGNGPLPEIRKYDPLLEKIEPGSVWRFRLTANPTHSVFTENQKSKRGKVRACNTTKSQKEWLKRQAEKHGFLLADDSFSVTGSQLVRFSKGSEGDVVTLLSVSYEGILQVTDAEAFRRLLKDGVGRGKAYGMGMMTVMRL